MDPSYQGYNPGGYSKGQSGMAETMPGSGNIRKKKIIIYAWK